MIVTPNIWKFKQFYIFICVLIVCSVSVIGCYTFNSTDLSNGVTLGGFIRKNYSICFGTYNFTKADNTPILIYDNGRLDCHGSTIIGNYPYGVIGAYGGVNTTIRNCTFINDAGKITMLSMAVLSSNSRIMFYNITGNFSMTYMALPLMDMRNFSILYSEHKTINISALNKVSIYDKTRIIYNLSIGDDWKIYEKTYSMPNKIQTLTTNTRINYGVYYLNAGASTFMFTIGGNINLNCNGAVFIGNKTGYAAGSFNTRNFVNITNCTFINYNTGVRFSAITNYLKLSNNDMSNNTNGISLSLARNITIFNNNFSCNNKSTSVMAVTLDRGTKSQIYNNNFLNCPRAINLGGHNQSHIYGNYFLNSTYRAVMLASVKKNNITGNRFTYNNVSFAPSTSTELIFNNNYLLEKGKIYVSGGTSGILTSNMNFSIIRNNTIINATWNGIDIDGYRNIITINTITKPSHSCIDMNSGTKDVKDGAYNNITKNTCFAYGQEIYILTQSNNIITDNVIYDGYISVEGNQSHAGNNYIFNNTLLHTGAYGTSNYTFFSGSKSNLWQSNKIYGSAAISDIYIQNYYNRKSQIENSSFINNSFNRPVIIKIPLGNNSNLINSSTKETIIYYAYGYSQARSYYLFWNGKKDIRITNKSITIYRMPAYSSYCNSTSAICQQNKAGNITETIPAGYNSFIVGYSSANEPRVYSRTPTIELTSYQYGGSYLLFTLSGAGTFNMTNMSRMGNDLYIYKDGYLYSSLTTDNASFTEGSWGVYTIDQTIRNSITDSCRSSVLGYASIGTLMPVVVIALVMFIIITLIVSLSSGNTSIETATSSVWAFVALIIGISIMILIFIFLPSIFSYVVRGC